MHIFTKFAYLLAHIQTQMQAKYNYIYKSLHNICEKFPCPIMHEWAECEERVHVASVSAQSEFAGQVSGTCAGIAMFLTSPMQECLNH